MMQGMAGWTEREKVFDRIRAVFGDRQDVVQVDRQDGCSTLDSRSDNRLRKERLL
jgi:hypothetical protein